MSVYIKTRVGKTGKRYLVYWRRGGRGFKEQYAGSFQTMKEAKTRRDLIAGELAAGRDPKALLDVMHSPAAPKPGLEQWWLRFAAARIDVGDKAHELYRSARLQWIPLLGATRDPFTIAAADIVDGIADLHQEYAPATIRSYLSVLAQVLEYAGVDPNPARAKQVKLPRARRAEREIPSNEAWQTILGHARKRSRLALRIEEACALRVSEACAIELGDVDFIDGAVRIRLEATKTAAGRRWVPVPRQLLDAIEAGLPPLEDRRPELRVLAVEPDEVYADLTRACTLAGVPKYGTHALRHRRISLWLRHGIDPIQVARWSGHSKPSESLNTYGHLVVDPRGDEWRDFWLETYAGMRSPGAAPVRHEEITE